MPNRPLPHGPRVALLGLEQAADRLRNARSDYLKGKPAEAVAIALTETTNWIFALDEHAWSKVGIPNYLDFRARSVGGRATGGVAYARQFHVHELISTNRSAPRLARPGELADPELGLRIKGRPGYRQDLQWVVFKELPRPRTGKSWGKDDMYKDSVELRPLTEPITEAIAWLHALPWP